tara:strand:- start:834 stop:1868 length:1035 start_codon:yes stop_codon:yes gene_type:complete
MAKESQPKEEIELGSLFIIIGKGFSNLFNFIATIFKGIYHLLILLLLFIKKNVIKLVLAAVIGGVIGTFFQLKKAPTFGADMQVQPNFKSTRQLYNNVHYYNDLVKQKDTAILAATFHLSSEIAATLKKFEIYPIKNGNDLLTSYDELILSVDTLTAKSYSFDVFKNTFTDYDYRIHNIHVVATKNDVFSKLDEVIISSVVNNKFFNKVKRLTNENLNRTDSLLRQNLTQVDSLRRVYMSVLIEKSKKENSGTTIDLGGTKTTNKELELFETNRRINKDLKEITEDKSEKSEVLNVISNFQPIGYEIKGIDQNYGVQVAVLGILLMVLFLLLKQLNIYLNNYKK